MRAAQLMCGITAAATSTASAGLLATAALTMSRAALAVVSALWLLLATSALWRFSIRRACAVGLVQVALAVTALFVLPARR